MKETWTHTRSIRHGLDSVALKDGQESGEDISHAADSKKFQSLNLTKLLLWSSTQIRDLFLFRTLIDLLTILNIQKKSREMLEKLL